MSADRKAVVLIALLNEQTRHLIAVKSKLSPDERAVLMAALPNMEPAQCLTLVAELCALPVEQAVEAVRSLMPPLRPRSRGERKP